MSYHGRNEADSDANGENQHHHHHDPGGGFFALHAQQTDKRHHRQSYQNFPKIHIIAKDRIEITMFDDRMQKIPRKQRDARGVGPEYRYVDQEHEPGDQEGTVIAKNVFYIGVQTSCPRITVSQKMIVI